MLRIIRLVLQSFPTFRTYPRTWAHFVPETNVPTSNVHHARPTERHGAFHETSFHIEALLYLKCNYDNLSIECVLLLVVDNTKIANAYVLKFVKHPYYSQFPVPQFSDRLKAGVLLFHDLTPNTILLQSPLHQAVVQPSQNSLHDVYFATCVILSPLAFLTFHLPASL